MARLGYSFFSRDCETVARELAGKILVHRIADAELRLRICETECYCGEDDTACHASKGKTKRTEVLYMDAGTVYIYLCYGIHWLMNIVTGAEGHPEAVLIRACVDADGPGKLTKKLGITGDLNRKSVLTGDELWIEDDGVRFEIIPAKRVGIGYASQKDQDRLWRFQIGKVLP